MEIGEKIKGDIPPHGGRWIRHEETDELELVEAPTSAAAAVQDEGDN